MKKYSKNYLALKRHSREIEAGQRCIIKIRKLQSEINRTIAQAQDHVENARKIRRSMNQEEGGYE